MIYAHFKAGKDGYIQAFSITGHAEFAEYGRDIVCAAVSAIAQSAVIGLEEYVGLKLEVVQQSGDLSCSLPAIAAADQRDAAEAVLRACYLGLLAVGESHSDYLSVELSSS